MGPYTAYHHSSLPSHMPSPSCTTTPLLVWCVYFVPFFLFLFSCLTSWLDSAPPFHVFPPSYTIHPYYTYITIPLIVIPLLLPLRYATVGLTLFSPHLCLFPCTPSAAFPSPMPTYPIPSPYPLPVPTPSPPFTCSFTCLWEDTTLHLVPSPCSFYPSLPLYMIHCSPCPFAHFLPIPFPYLLVLALPITGWCGSFYLCPLP